MHTTKVIEEMKQGCGGIFRELRKVELSFPKFAKGFVSEFRRRRPIRNLHNGMFYADTLDNGF